MAIRSSSRRFVFRAEWLGPVLLLVAAAAGVVWLLGSGKLPFFGTGKASIPLGRIAVPMSARAIPAYIQVSRSHLLDPKGSLAVVYLNQSTLSPRVLTSLQDILGRVLKDDKPAGYVFTEDDFLPKGTKPGLTAGIPPGKRAMRLEGEQVKGFYGLRAGDRFDLVATIPLDPKAVDKSLKLGSMYDNTLTAQASLANVQKQATVNVIVRNGVIVSPLAMRQVPAQSRSLTQGTTTRARPVQEVVIAIDPDEVATLTEALAVGAQVMSVPRSGHPEDPPESRIASRRPRSPFGAGFDGGSLGLPDSFTAVETIAGTKRQITTVPRE